MKRQKPRKKLVLGITGSFGTGKTTVARIFKSYGARIIDADKLAHQCLYPGSSSFRKIVDLFGSGILRGDGKIERKKIACIVFSDKQKLKELNKIIHPEVIKKIRLKINSAKEKVLILDVPLLIESGLNKIVDKLIVVKTTPALQLKRVSDKTHLNKTQITKRINSQIPLRIKVRLADFVIDNSGTKEETKRQVRDVWKSLVCQKARQTRDKFAH